MRRTTRPALGAAALLLLLGCGADDDAPEAASEPTSTTAEAAAETTTTTEVPTELTVVTVPSTVPGEVNPAATGSVLMLKLDVGDIDAAEAFYGYVFGANLAMAMGEGVHILTLPGGGPGLVLIENDSEDAHRGAFIMQVPDLEASRALALEAGATEQQRFEGDAGGQAAQSIDLLDPWGNQIEILQLG